MRTCKSVTNACVCAHGQAFLRHLQRAGVDMDVVFIDMDALVVAPVAPLFAPAGTPAAFDYAVTLSDAVDMYALHVLLCFSHGLLLRPACVAVSSERPCNCASWRTSFRGMSRVACGKMS